MNNDTLYALILAGIFASIIMRGWFCYMTLETLLKLTRPGATVLLLFGLVWIYTRGLPYTALMYAIIIIYLIRDIWSNWTNSDARRLHIESNEDQKRFKQEHSVDLQWARHIVQHDSPNMLHKDVSDTPLLLYPPSEATLKSMSG